MESVLGETPHEFESRILRQADQGKRRDDPLRVGPTSIFGLSFGLSCAVQAGTATPAASSSGPLSAPGLGRSGAFQMSPPTRLAMSCRIGSVRCWYRAAMPVLDHPMIPMTARSATPRIKKHRCCGVPGVV